MRDWIAKWKHLKNQKWDGRTYYQPMEDDDNQIIFDCSHCGDPTAGSYDGPILSNMCWKCNTKYQQAWTNFNRR